MARQDFYPITVETTAHKPGFVDVARTLQGAMNRALREEGRPLIFEPALRPPLPSFSARLSESEDAPSLACWEAPGARRRTFVIRPGWLCVPEALAHKQVLECFLAVQLTASGKPAFVDLTLALENAMRAASLHAEAALGFERRAGERWQARGPNRRRFEVQRRELLD